MPSARHVLRQAASRLTRSYPFLSGCGTIAQSPLLARLLAGETEPQVVRLRSGEAIVVPPQDFVGRSVYWFGDLDPKVSWICQRLLRPGDTAVDIGTNIGLIALAMAGRVGAAGAVHGFEPQPRLADLVSRSAALNGFGQLHIHRVALGPADATASFFVPDVNGGSASLVRQEGAGHRIEVPVRQAGAYLAGLALGPIRLMKIDVEGYEAEVIAGAADYLATNPPAAILFECNDDSVPFAQAAVVQALARLDYRFFAIRKVMVRMALTPIDLTDAQGQVSHDILAVHRSAGEAEIVAAVGAKPG